MCYPKQTTYCIYQGQRRTSANHNETRGISIVRECIISAGLSEDTADIIMQSWRPATRKQYGSYYKRWMHFCSERQIDKINPSVGNVVAFLTDLYDEGLSYSAINTAKSMLSSVFEIINRDIGKEVLIRRFMKGIFHLRPVIPKTIFTWDVKVVLKFLSSLEDNKLTLRMISVKLALLLVLTTGQRCQTIHAILLKNMEFGKNDVKIRIGDLLKQTKPNNHLAELYFEEYKLNDKICVVKVLKSYLQRTKDLRKLSNLFITSQKPHAAASKSTIASWIKLGLRLTGIDLNLYTPHSTRSASTSALVSKIPIDTIIKTAGWTNNCTFRKFYNRPVSNDSVLARIC